MLTFKSKLKHTNHLDHKLLKDVTMPFQTSLGERKKTEKRIVSVWYSMCGIHCGVWEVKDLSCSIPYISTMPIPCISTIPLVSIAKACDSLHWPWHAPKCIRKVFPKLRERLPLPGPEPMKWIMGLSMTQKQLPKCFHYATVLRAFWFLC